MDDKWDQSNIEIRSLVAFLFIIELRRSKYFGNKDQDHTNDLSYEEKFIGKL